jgi:RNA polymerase sigma factor (sigma-70 family)
MDVATLVTRARAGDVNAFTELVRRYQAMAFGSAYAQLGDFHLAEDAAQQAFITAWRNLAKLRRDERFGGWLRGIVRFECAHLRRSRQLTLSLDAALEVPAATPGPAQTVEERDGYARVLATIDALPAPEREAAVLYYLHDQSQREVAAFLDVPVTTVNNRLRLARQRLKAGGVLPMAKETFTHHGLPDDFAERIGEIVRAEGAVIEARFAPDRRPAVLNTLAVTDDRGAVTHPADVIQLLDDDLVRCLAVRGGALVAGARVIDTATPVRAPVDAGAVRQLVASLRPGTMSDQIVETGIKAIDVLCPLPMNGVVALAGDMQTGKMVLVEELVRRLVATQARLALLVFVETPAEVAVIQQETYRTSATIQAIYLPVADTSPEVVGAMTEEIDAVVTLSRAVAKERCYPAIDPVRSISRPLAPAIVGEE